MSYTSFECNEGAVLERVESMCRHLTTNGSFTDSSSISLPDVERYIDDSYYWLVGELAKNGYAISVTDTQVKAVLEQIQALDAVAQIEFSQPVTADGEPNDRFKGIVARRDRMVNDYIRGDVLQQLGHTRERSKSEYLNATGRSQDRKRTVYTDSDVVPSRFPRGFGQRKDVPHRSGAEPTSGADPDQL